MAIRVAFRFKSVGLQYGVGLLAIAGQVEVSGIVTVVCSHGKSASGWRRRHSGSRLYRMEAMHIV